VNVIPGRASVDIDGRTLPGQSESDFLAELRSVLDPTSSERGPRLDVLRSLPPVEASPNTALFEALGSALKRHDRTAIPVPYMIPGLTDAKAYSRMGTTCYGFAPVRFDPTHEVSFGAMYHGHDERIPVDGLGWGLRVLYDAVFAFASGEKDPSQTTR
jgi:acetylornithine deacetylase/succinyl-diaminopimelate desuccinylase-like protein